VNKSERMVKYLGVDVLTAAKRRIEHVIDTFDSIAVCFSGGKDSLVVLHLVEEVYRERGIKERINVIFRDEELIPDDVIDFVLWHTRQPQYKFYYYAIPLKSNKFILGVSYDYVQWDEGREWIRNKPDIAIKDCGGRVMSQYDMDSFAAQNFKGKIAFVTGIRADESLVRFRAIVNKKQESFIAATEASNVHMIRPIYDWTQADVFRYFYDRKIKYCPIYDIQMLNGEALRVSTPLHAERSKRFGKIKTRYPVFYQQLVDLFPEMLTQERYWNELDRYGVIDRYEHSWGGILAYIKDNLEEHQAALAKDRVYCAKHIRETHLSAGRGLGNFGGYPIRYVFRQIVNGGYKRIIQPCKNPTKEDIAYEQV
jgi:predicted phosphoadenosine phosphosulfate sulfurtransferase